MPILALISIAFQVFFGIHALRTGRERWLWLIIVFPFVGCLIYFIAEYLPELKNSPRSRQVKRGVIKAIDPGGDIRRLKLELERTDSINNRKALAEAYVNAGRFDEAIPLYESCLSGVHVDDPAILEGMSLAYFLKGEFKKAQEKLFKLKEIQDDTLSNNFMLLLARTYEELGELENALQEYEMVVKHFSGEEAMYRYGLLLKKMGKKEEAGIVFNEILREVRIAPKFYRKSQKHWVDVF